MIREKLNKIRSYVQNQFNNFGHSFLFFSECGSEMFQAIMV